MIQSKSMNLQEFQSDIDSFYGYENLYFRQTLSGRIEYTDGIRFLQHNGCCWLIDAICSYQTPEFKAENDRQFWKLVVTLSTGQAQLMCDDGNGNIRITQDIPFTDFPLSEIKIYVEIQHCVFLCLLSEY
jgi:hypothetical protein